MHMDAAAGLFVLATASCAARRGRLYVRAVEVIDGDG
jgi:hypothetical protein